MRKTITIVAIYVLAVSLAFAEETTTVKEDYNLRAEGTEAFTGAVKEVMAADLTRPNSELIVTGEDGNDTKFIVSPTAAVYNSSDGRLLNLKGLQAGEKIQVNYNTTKEGAYKAVAVKVLAKDEGMAKIEEAMKEELIKEKVIKEEEGTK